MSASLLDENEWLLDACLAQLSFVELYCCVRGCR